MQRKLNNIYLVKKTKKHGESEKKGKQIIVENSMLIQKWDTQTKIPTVKIFVWEKPRGTEINNSTWNLRANHRFHNANIYKARWSEWCVVWCGARTKFTESQGIAPHEIKWTTNSIRGFFSFIIFTFRSQFDFLFLLWICAFISHRYHQIKYVQ